MRLHHSAALLRNRAATACVALLAALGMGAGTLNAAPSQGATANTEVKRGVAKAYASLLKNRRVTAAVDQIKADDAQTFREQIEIAEIPAPTFKESVRALDYLRRLQKLGVSDASIDAEGNVIARRKGAGRGPTLVLAAHLDTVFPESADVKVHEKDGRFYGRGLADDARGLAVLLSVLRVMQSNQIQTYGDVLFVGTVGEEGLGNLRGVTALLRDNPGIDGFISVDAVDSPDTEHRYAIFSRAVGSRRWSLTFRAPGGHSYGDFGSPSAVHSMGRAIASLSELRTSSDPKTTFTVAIASGGSAINAIAAEAQMQVDLRSESAELLAALERAMFAAAEEAVKAENARWNSSAIRMESTLLGDRPAGASADDTAVVAAAQVAAMTLGLPVPHLKAGNTDSNVPLALGVPAATLNGGGEADNLHSSDEWYRPTNAWLGPQSVLLTALALVGVSGVSQPTLPER